MEVLFAFLLSFGLMFIGFYFGVNFYHKKETKEKRKTNY